MRTRVYSLISMQYGGDKTGDKRERKGVSELLFAVVCWSSVVWSGTYGKTVVTNPHPTAGRRGGRTASSRHIVAPRPPFHIVSLHVIATLSLRGVGP